MKTPDQLRREREAAIEWFEELWDTTVYKPAMAELAAQCLAEHGSHDFEDIMGRGRPCRRCEFNEIPRYNE